MKASSRGHLVTLPALAIMFLFLVGLSLLAAQQTSPKTQHSAWLALAGVPAKPRAKPNPMASDPNAIAAGRKLFEEHCAQCHGMQAAGGARAPSLRTQAVGRATPGALFWIVTNGVVRHGMPVWHKLPASERWQIVTFLKSVSSETPRRGNPE
ncbi:MAG TPA: c-type cytochrome [Candidatus Acidoferrales bacterium]|nr:c-type cytochrome [Candidatus Acidoferrales bacterium]